MKPLGQGDQLGLASPLKYAAIQSGKTKSPSNKEAGLDASYQPSCPLEEDGEEFFLDILFNRMSEIAIFRQLTHQVICLTAPTPLRNSKIRTRESRFSGGEMLERYFGVVAPADPAFLVPDRFRHIASARFALGYMADQEVPASTRAKSIYCRVVIGGITDVFASSLLAIPLLIYIQIAHKGADAISSSIHSSGLLYWLQLATGFGCSVLGGYVAAWIAKHDELLNGLLSSFPFIAIGVYYISLAKDPQSVLVQILLLAAAPAFAFLGGYLRQTQKRISGHDAPFA